MKQYIEAITFEKTNNKQVLDKIETAGSSKKDHFCYGKQ